MKLWQRIFVVVAASAIVPSSVWAASNSTSYSIQEDLVGGTGDVNSASASYKSLGNTDGGQTLGEATIGNSSSGNFQTNSGFNTTNSPVLGVSITASSVNLGTLSSTATRTGTAAFSVLDYTSYGYVVQIIGPPPTSSGRQLTPLTTGGTSAVGTEQFGINLVANTSPSTFGADPVQVPDNTFSFGAAATGYNTNGTFRYNSGDTIARSLKSSGETDYTMSYMTNASPVTPPGLYTASQTLVVTATY